MARSTYVYVVIDVLSPVAGFTVKRELVAWLRRYPHRHHLMTVWRLPDGGPGDGRRNTPLRIEELLDD